MDGRSPKILRTVGAIRKEFGVSEETVYGWIAQNAPIYKVGRMRMAEAWELWDWLKGGGRG